MSKTPDTSLASYIEHIRSIRDTIEQAHDALNADDHLQRMVLIGQRQILDAVLAVSSIYDLPIDSPTDPPTDTETPPASR